MICARTDLSSWHKTCVVAFIVLKSRSLVFPARGGAGQKPGAVGLYQAFRSTGETIMLYWAMVFLIIALVAGILGFTGVYVAAAGIAKVLFFVFLVLFLISLISGGISRRSI
jgi:uncharacterized membrane protein YtjA (UPF0391 family)